MDFTEHLCTVTLDDIDWKSLSSLDEVCIKRARELDIHFPTIIVFFKNGVAEVRWQLNPDCHYYMDEDGYGLYLSYNQGGLKVP